MKFKKRDSPLYTMDEILEMNGISTDNNKAKWIISSDGYYPYCSNCNYKPDKMTKYCPDCGCIMKGE